MVIQAGSPDHYKSTTEVALIWCAAAVRNNLRRYGGSGRCTGAPGRVSSAHRDSTWGQLVPTLEILYQQINEVNM